MARAYVIADDELHTIIAALRHWQATGQCDANNRTDDIHDLATNGGEVTSLTQQSVDALCMALNMPDAESNDVVVQEGDNLTWMTITAENEIVTHDTEAEACAVQRGWRMALGMDPMTGEYL